MQNPQGQPNAGMNGPPGGAGSSGQNMPGMDNAFAQMGLSYGQKMMSQGAGSIEKYVSVSSLRRYFNVDHSFVLARLLAILCPFLSKNARPQMGEPGSGKDTNRADLYIPTMAWATYVLLVGFSLGSQKNFTPDALGRSATASLLLVAIEVIAQKGAIMVLNVPGVKLTDLVAFSGYKFVG